MVTQQPRTLRTIEDALTIASGIVAHDERDLADLLQIQVVLTGHLVALRTLQAQLAIAGGDLTPRLPKVAALIDRYVSFLTSELLVVVAETLQA